MIGSTRARTPWHLWVIGIVAMLWNGFGCLDFWMTVTRDMDWLAALPPDAIDWLDVTPVWGLTSWALGVWGGLAGSLLLLLRSRWATALFALSLVGLAINQVYLLEPGTPEMMRTTGSMALRGGIWIVAIGLLCYAIRMRVRMVLR
ncbi:hypothetical protein WBP07_11185 [Novosphingobium sp. BL-8A]|uniref:hypothetical protein n=1 Tax=Novosphingobium sp. BL-8A TaxID=3127639 RepID=UPI0037582EB8